MNSKFLNWRISTISEDNLTGTAMHVSQIVTLLLIVNTASDRRREGSGLKLDQLSFTPLIRTFNARRVITLKESEGKLETMVAERWSETTQL